jgi:predicted dehydrogenase
LKTFPKAPKNKVGKYVLDANDSAIMTVEFANGAIGTIHPTRWATGHANTVALRVFGDKGAIRINLDESYSELNICHGKDVDKAKLKKIKCPATPIMYKRFIQSIKTGKNDQPDFARGAEVQKILDACFVSDSKGYSVKL